MNVEIQQAEALLKNSGLFSSVDKKAIKGDEYLIPYFRARRVDMVWDVRGAEKVIKEIEEKIAPFTVGQGCAVCYYTDVHAARVIWVSEDGKRIRVQEDKATLLNGVNSGEPDALKFYPGGFCGHTSGTQRWDLQADPNGKVHEFSLRANGEWRAKGDSMRSPSKTLSKSHFHHYDYNF